MRLAILLIVSQPLLSQEIVSPDNLLDSRSTQATLASWPSKMLHDFAGRGISFQYAAVHDLSFSASAPSALEQYFARYSWDLSASVNGGRLFGWQRSRGFVRLKQHVNELGNDSSGAAQLYSNIDANSRTTLYELWLQQTFWNERVRVKGGKIDANTEFAVVESAADFLNSSMGYSPTIMALPTYPEPQAGLELSLGVARNARANLGVFKTSGAGRILLGEAAGNWTIGAGELAGRSRLGYWSLHKSIQRFDGDEISGTQGVYGIVEQTLWRAPAPNSTQPERSLTAFVQYGNGNGRENPYLYHLGVGTIVNSPLRARPADGAGIAATIVGFSDDPDSGFDQKQEQVVEAYYRYDLGHHSAFVMDLQFFHHPGGLHCNPDYVVATPRLTVSF